MIAMTGPYGAKISVVLIPLDRSSEVFEAFGSDELAAAELLLGGFCSSQGMPQDVAVQLL